MLKYYGTHTKESTKRRNWINNIQESQYKHLFKTQTNYRNLKQYQSNERRIKCEDILKKRVKSRHASSASLRTVLRN